MTEVVNEAPPAVTSPDGTYQIYNNGDHTLIRSRLNPDEQYRVQTQGVTPGLSTDNSKLVWVVRSGVSVPGQAYTLASVWVSEVDGTNAREVLAGGGLSAQWLDAHRLLITQPDAGRITTLEIFDTRDDSSYTLGTWRNIRGLTVSPGGSHLTFMLTWQDDPAADGIYLLETSREAQPQQMPWFGGWRWRDSESIYYLPFDPASPNHTLVHYHIPTGESQTLITPEEAAFTIMNGDWDVSADGRRILFHNAADWNMWLLETE